MKKDCRSSVIGMGEGIATMADFLQIGKLYINLDNVSMMEEVDLYTSAPYKNNPVYEGKGASVIVGESIKAPCMVVEFAWGLGENKRIHMFQGLDNDLLRAWIDQYRK